MTRNLKISVDVVLVAAILIDVVLCGLTWVSPETWFEVLHGTSDNAAFYPFLRRCGGHWAAFALFQLVALVRWRQAFHWLVLAAGLRFSDLFTDLTYLLSSPNLSSGGGLSLLVPPVLNLGMGLLLMYAFHQALAATGRAGLRLVEAPASAPA